MIVKKEKCNYLKVRIKLKIKEEKSMSRKS